MYPVRECCSVGELMDAQAAGQPVVVRGLVSDWPMVKKNCLGLAELRNYILGYDVGLPFQAMIASSSQNGRLFYNEDISGFNFDRLNGDLPEAFRILEALSREPNSPTFYIGSKKVNQYLPGLELEIMAPGLDGSVSPSIWIGNESIVATHNDDSENFACVAVGSRTFTLFPPEEQSNLYLGPENMTPAGRVVSMVDLKAPDYRAFPRFRRAQEAAQFATLNPGDLIYIPTHWWHHVEALSPLNVLINFWWRD